MAAPIALPDFGEDDHYVKTSLTKMTPPEDPPSFRDLTNATRLVSDLLIPHGLGRVTDETLVKAQEYKDSLYARRRGPENMDGIGILQAFRNDIMQEIRGIREEMRGIREEMRDIKESSNATRIMVAKHLNLVRGSGENAVLEIVPFRDGTMPPPHLPALINPLAVLQLNPRQLNEYHRGYLEGNPPHVIETRKKNILVAIGSTYVHRV